MSDTKPINGDAARITLKAVRLNAAMSEETTCYSATVYLDGKKVGTAMNHGHGGPDFYRWSDDAGGAEVERIGSEYDPSPYGGLETLMGVLLDRFEDEKVAKRYAKKGTPVSVFVEVGDGREARIALPTARQVADVQADYPGKKLRVIDLTAGKKVYDNLHDFCLDYPRATQPSVWTETEKVDGDTLVYVVDCIAHEFTDAARKSSDKKMFQQYVDQQNALTKAGVL